MDKKITFKKLLFILLILININSVTSKVSESAPEASSFSEIKGSTEPSYSGDLGFSVPLLTVPGRNQLNLPLNLIYSSGLRLEDEASFVGLGWHLGVGVIQRSVVNVPDDSDRGLFGSGSDDFGDQDYYYISFPGGNGRLFVPNSEGPLNREVWLSQTWQPIKVDPDFSGNKIVKWTVIGPDGTIYIFGESVERRQESQETKSITCNLQNTNTLTASPVDRSNKLSSNYIYAWYLTEIRSSDYADTDGITGLSDNDQGNWLKLNYSNYANPNEFYKHNSPHIPSGIRPSLNEYMQPGSSTWKDQTYNFNFLGATYGPQAYIASFHYQKVVSQIQKKYLSFVETPIAKATFNLVNNRLDGLSDDAPTKKPYKLDSIEIRTKFDSNMLSKVNFDYDYSLARGSEGDYTKGRLTLRSVSVCGEGGTNCLPPTTFEYYGSSNEYPYYRFNYDLWDFNNYGPFQGMNTGPNILKCLTWQNERADDLINNILFDATNNVSSKGDYAKAWSIKKVTYPTGGSISYDYETDQYRYLYNTRVSGGWRKGGGVRLLNQTVSDGLGNNYTSFFSYKSIYQGNLFNETGVSTKDRTFSDLRLDWSTRLDAKFSQYVSYDIIWTKLPSNYGYTITYFKTPKNLVDPIVDPDGAGTRCQPTILTYNEAKRGMQKRKALVNSANSNVSEVNNDFFVFLPKGNYYDNSYNQSAQSNDCNFNYYIYSEAVQQTQVQQSIEGDLTNGLVTTSIFEEFNPDNNIPKTTKVTNNKLDGTSEIKITKTNFIFENNALYPWARIKNILTAPEEVLVYKDSVAPANLKAWQGMEYSNFGDLVNPQYYLQKQKAWLDSNYDNLMQETEKVMQQEIVAYDNYGQALHAKDANNKYVKSYYGDNSNECSNSPLTFKNAYLTCLEQGSSQHRIKTHYNNDGTILEIIDENNQLTSFAYDEFNRLLSSTIPGEPDPSIIYDYQYAEDLINSQDPTVHPDCNNGLSEQCTNRVKTSTILSYRDSTPEAQFKVAKYWDGLGRVHMSDIMVKPGIEHIRTFNEYNEIGQIKSTSDMFLENRQDWIRQSPPKSSNFLDSLLGYLGLSKEQEIPKPIAVADPYDTKFDDNGIKRYSNIQRSMDPDPSSPIDKSYIFFESSPLLRPITAYSFDGELVSDDPDPTDPHISTSYGSELIGSTKFLYTLVTDEENKLVKSFTDKFGNTIKTIQAQGTQNEVITLNNFDVLGRAISTTSAVGSPESQTTTNTYDTLGRLISTTNPDFGTITNTYYPNGNLQTKNHNGITSTYSYDDLNRITQIEFTYETSNPSFPRNSVIPLQGPIKYYYDTYFNAANIRDSSKCALVSYPDIDNLAYPKGRLVAVEKYKAPGSPPTDLESISCFLYDEKGRVKEQITRIKAISNPLYKIKYSYSLAGSLIRVIDPVNVATTYDYNNLNQIVETNINNYILNPSFEVDNLVEDTWKNIPDSWKIQGDLANDFYLLSYHSDDGDYSPQEGDYNLRIKIMPNKPDKGIKQIIPDLVNGQNYILSFKFNRRDNNDMSNVFKVIVKDSSESQITTQQFGNTYALNEWHTASVPFTARCSAGISSCKHTIAFYSTSQSSTIEFHLDSIKLEPGERATEFSFAKNEFNYDQTINNVIYGNKVTTNYWYNPRKWVNYINVKNSQGDPLFQRTYSYTDSGNMDNIFWTVNEANPGSTAGLDDIESFVFDDLHRLDRYIFAADIVEYGGFIGNYELDYDYDKVGNRKAEKLWQSSPRTLVWQGNYIYTDSTSKNRLSSVNTNEPEQPNSNYAYDSRGNMITKTENNLVTRYKYDASNMLAWIDYPDRSYSKYIYNADGLRIYKYDNKEQQVTFYIYDINGNLVFEDYEYNICGNGPCLPGGSPMFLKPIQRQIEGGLPP